MTVYGQVDDSWERIAGYSTDLSQAATKTPSPIVETPESISVIGHQQITDQGSTSVADAVRYTPGAFGSLVGAENRYDYISLRGFSDGNIDNIYLDGLKVLGDSGSYSTSQIDPFFLERVDILKGPSSVLYGNSSPGGIVMLESKRPDVVPHQYVQLQGGNRSTRGSAFDLTGPMTADGTLSYRLLGRANQTNTQYHLHKPTTHYAFMPQVTWTPDDKTSLNLQAYIQHDGGNSYHSGVPMAGALDQYHGKRISSRFFDGDPSDLFHRNEAMIGYEFGHQFNKIWSVRQNMRYIHSRVNLRQTYGYGYLNSQSEELNRYYTGAQEMLNSYAVDNIAEADFHTGPIKHTLLMGLDYQWRRTHEALQQGLASPLNAFAPDYSLPLNLNIYGDTRYRRDLTQTGTYLSDMLSWKHWRLSLGGREDWVRIHVHDTTSGTTTSGKTNHHFSGKAGLLYAFDNGVSPFIDYSESFIPGSNTNINGNLLKPTKGKQWEGGVKFQPKGTNDAYTLALYHIDESNIATSTPNQTYYTPVGKVRSAGVELETHTHLTPDWLLNASYAYDALKYKKYNEGTNDYAGNTPYGAPKHQANVWSTYRFNGGTLSGLILGGGVRYQSGIWVDAANSRKLPSVTLVDAMLRYDFSRLGAKGLTFQLNVNNLFNRHYVSSCYDSTDYCYFGQDRSMLATVGYTF
ncbi:TonB-dependent siderophore receptor [Cernens ardua]|uniref:TonB-dependent siderophore receptor n=1 Tax=Cernens ardua TaxID=3402176 RepID=UPI003F9AE2C1